MRLEWDSDKEARNRAKHGLGFSLARHVIQDPLAVIIYDRFEGGEHRWHAVAVIGGKCLVLVHAYPDPDDETLLRVIGLREATARERRNYEKTGFVG